MASVGITVILNGNCREAVAFYADVFGQALPLISTYAELKCAHPDFRVPDCMKSRVRSAVLRIAGSPIEFCDTPNAHGFVCDNNLLLTVACENAGEAKRVFDRLSEGGEVDVACRPATNQFCGVLKDRFHTGWIIKAPHAMADNNAERERNSDKDEQTTL